MPSHPVLLEADWTQIIQPQDRLFDLKLRELWQYRDLIVLFVRRDFVSQYKQTILGPAWHLIQPLLTTLMFTIVFGKIAQIPTDGVAALSLLHGRDRPLGLFLRRPYRHLRHLHRQRRHLRQGLFPAPGRPLAGLLSRLIAFGIQFLFFLCFLAYFMLSGSDAAPNAWALLTPLLLLMMAALGLGLGVIVSSLTTRYRDLTVVVGFGVQLLMYATPVIYPLSVLPEPYRSWMHLNPSPPSWSSSATPTWGPAPSVSGYWPTASPSPA
jgi:lipopolysaccharide transport system permease protein